MTDQLSGGLSTAKAGFGKADAIRDSRSAVTASINEILNSGISSVFNTDNVAGAYNSTTQLSLANDLAAKAAARGAGVQQKAITDYASIGITKQDQAVKNLLSSIAQISEGNIATEQTTQETGVLDQATAATQRGTSSQQSATDTATEALSEAASTQRTQADTTTSTSSTQEQLRETTDQSTQIQLQEQEGVQDTDTSQESKIRKEDDNFFESIGF